MAGRLTALQIASLLLVALAGSALTITLLALRIRHTGLIHFGFLAWNLALAWIPMLLALALLGGQRLGARALPLLTIMAAWLLFLPNAPYLVTDVIHLRTVWGGVPWWFDVALIGSAAATGLLLGYASLLIVQAVVARRHGEVAGWLLAVAALLLSGVGVYMGRFLRLNSWDVVSRPGALAGEARVRLGDPLANELFLGVVAIVGTLLIAGYLVFVAATATFANGRRRSPAR